MGEAKMELGERELEKIGEYVKSHLPQWMSETGAVDALGTKEARTMAFYERELDILERVVRVEDELKKLREVMEERFGKMDERFDAMQNQMDKRFEAQRELSNERFEAMDKRFEAMQNQMDKRFDAMDKRFSFNQRILGIGFTAIALLIVVLNYLG
jgi:predicted  nucleic acid-binding Zn-ribbon protein